MRNAINEEMDGYISKMLHPESPTKIISRQKAEEMGASHMCLSHAEGLILRTFVSAKKCRKFIEIGTLTGLSSLYIIDGLAVGGKLWTFEKNEKNAKIAKEIFEHSSVRKDISVEVVIGDAQASLNQKEEQGPFDGIFIDADKGAYLEYLSWAEKNLESGALIIADNIFLKGGVWGATQKNFNEKQIHVMKEFNQRLFDPNKFEGSIIPTTEGLYIGIKK